MVIYMCTVTNIDDYIIDVSISIFLDKHTQVIFPTYLYLDLLILNVDNYSISYFLWST